MGNPDECLESCFSSLIFDSLGAKEVDLSPYASQYLITTVSDLSTAAHKLVGRNLSIPEFVNKGLGSEGVIRTEYLRIAGDAALITTGIFPDSISGDRTYFSFGDYLDLGQRAYGSIRTEIFDELALKFPQLVDVLNTVSLNIHLTSNNLNRYVLRRRTIDAYTSGG